MVAGPLVRGAGLAGTVWAAAANVAATLVGSALTAAVLVGVALIGGRLPIRAVGAVCLLAGLAVAVESRVPAPGSRWMVPREWARFGPTAYAAAFGLALGTGVATMVPSAALYALLTAAETAPAWWQSLGLLLTFGGTRALLVVILTVRSARRGRHPMEDIGWVALVSTHAATVEVALAAALGAEVLRAL